ncbi:MAG: hypothetical protein AABZ44_05985 [Elusimicrobiota bacterium]
MKRKHPGLLSAKQRRILWVLVSLAAAGCAVGFYLSVQRAFANLLISNLYFLSLALFGVVFVAMHAVARAGYHVAFKRIPEAMSGYILPGGLLMCAIAGGSSLLYHWAHEDVMAQDPILAGKEAYLNPSGFVVRALVFCVVWYGFSRWILWNSRRQDAQQDPGPTLSNVAVSAAFLAVFAVTFSLAAVDWLMSLEPHWYSTLFPWYIASGMLASGFAALTLILLEAKRKGYYREVNEYHFHDIGKFFFAFCCFWSYLWFSQYLLIWYSNIPEETVFFIARTKGWWLAVFLLNFMLNWLLPFALLLPAAHKKSAGFLAAAATSVLVGRWVDLYLIVMPIVMHSGPKFGYCEIAAFMLIGALFLLLMDRESASADMTPGNDPYLAESLQHHA